MPAARTAFRLLGCLLIASPLYFVSAAVLNGLGVGFLFEPIRYIISDPARAQIFNLGSPILFPGGLLAAVILNGATIFARTTLKENGQLVPVMAVKPKLWNLAVMLAGVALLGILMTYAFLENFSHCTL